MFLNTHLLYILYCKLVFLTKMKKNDLLSNLVILIITIIIVAISFCNSWMVTGDLEKGRVDTFIGKLKKYF